MLDNQDFLTPPEFDRLIKSTYKDKHKTAFLLGFACGLRISECTKLQKEDINRYTNQLHIRESKGGKERFVPYSKRVTPFLKNIPLDISHRALQIAFKKAVARAGIKKDLHFHSLRHSYASNMLRGGANLKQVQQLLGHSNISTTSVYLHTTKEELKEKVEEIQKGW